MKCLQSTNDKIDLQTNLCGILRIVVGISTSSTQHLQNELVPFRQIFQHTNGVPDNPKNPLNGLEIPILKTTTRTKLLMNISSEKDLFIHVVVHDAATHHGESCTVQRILRAWNQHPTPFILPISRPILGTQTETDLETWKAEFLSNTFS